MMNIVLFSRRSGEKFPRVRAQALDDFLLDAMAYNGEEADTLTGIPNLCNDSIMISFEKGGDVDDGDFGGAHG